MNRIIRSMINIIYPVVLYLVITFGIVLAIRGLDLRIEAGNVILVLILQQTASFIVIYWIYRLQNRTGALKQKFHFSDLGIKNLVLIIAATYFVLSSISLLSVVLRLNESFTGYSEVYKIITAGPIPLQFISAVILAPALEEVLCRGIIYNRMREISNFFVSALVSSLIWSAAHMNVVQGFTAFLYGIFLAFLYEKFKTLWVTIGSHSLFNLIAVASGYLAALSEKSIEADVEMMGPADAAAPLIINLLIAVWLIHLLHPSKLLR